MKPDRSLRILAFGTCLWGATLGSAQDAERATHVVEAARPQVAWESRDGDFLVRQYQLGCLSQLSYLLRSGGTAVVVDPMRDVDHYIQDAQELGAAIRYVLLTHTNADFVAGHVELAARTGAEILISKASGSEFRHRGLSEGDRTALGDASIEALSTPGHTFDSMSFLLRRGADAAPLLFTGDALFIGSIGRPDLASGTTSPSLLAAAAFDTVQRLKRLPPDTVILPGHGAGSLCGAHLSSETVSTIGREKAENPFLADMSRAAFITRDLAGLPPAPAYFAKNVAINRAGPPVVEGLTPPPELSPEAVAARIAAGAWVVDVREAADWAPAHLPGSIVIPLRGRLDTWFGTVIPFEASVVLVGDESEAQEAAFRLRRIGIDRIEGRLAGGVAAWQAEGRPVARTTLLSAEDLMRRRQSGDEPIIVDVRSEGEYAELRIGEVTNLPLPDIARLPQTFDKDRDLLFVCNSAYRSTMAVGLAERMGFTRASSLDGGLDVWIEKSGEVVGSRAAEIPAKGSIGSPSGPLRLPEAIEPRGLADALLDRPGDQLVYDLRPAAAFEEYHVPGARNLTPQEALEQAGSLPIGSRIVLVDRDGSIAWAVAGALADRPQTAGLQVRVLQGGTTRFFLEIEAGGGKTPGTAPRPAAPTEPAPVPAKPKKRSAGC